MKIKRVSLTPLFMTFKEAYHWSGRIDYGATVILVKVETDEGLVGYGESTSCFPAEAALGLIGNIIPPVIGQSPFDVDRIIYRARHLGLINDTIRMPNLLLTGLEMALWDIIGQAAGRPLYQLWGGATREYVDYFGFVQGDTAEELAASAVELSKAGHEIIYMKVGRGERSDVANTRAVREAIGAQGRLRVDANEAWNVFTAKNMIRRLAEFDLEFIEQPVDCRSLAALKQVRDASPVPIAVDQGAYSLEEVYEACRTQAADVLVLSPHETGGAANFKKAAAIGEAARVPVCLHGQFTTALTDVFHHHLALTLPNLTDGNQIMHQLLVDNLLSAPDMTPVRGRVGLPEGPGLGLVLDEDVIGRARENYGKWVGENKKNVDFVYSYE
ncbi:mandelate racemase/muconate lactonizing enzyme family protein [Deltaproteobacteria bacterium OttesenSCG-928-M10]|nr:mandelate racemase/muconate lactonizing enzyme family protein [Deltaproteobacteria bacterium OttesenSCG-928-M10]